MEKLDVVNLPWEPLTYVEWSGIRTVDATLGGTVLYFEDIRNYIKKILQDLSIYFDISRDKLEELFWEKNRKNLNIRDTNSYVHTNNRFDPFARTLGKLIFPKPQESPEIVKIKILFKSLSSEEQANLLQELYNQKQ